MKRWITYGERERKREGAGPSLSQPFSSGGPRVISLCSSKTPGGGLWGCGRGQNSDLEMLLPRQQWASCARWPVGAVIALN